MKVKTIATATRIATTRKVSYGVAAHAVALTRVLFDLRHRPRPWTNRVLSLHVEIPRPYMLNASKLVADTMNSEVKRANFHPVAIFLQRYFQARPGHELMFLMDRRSCDAKFARCAPLRLSTMPSWSG